MAEIQASVEKLADGLRRLGARSAEIGRITGVIREVTDRTHLLALNAAILATRAGEDGRAFSVVADEVKALAQRTAGSTREIEKLIETVQTDTEASVTLAGEGLASVRSGSRLVTKMSDALASILRSAEESSAKSRTMQEATASVAASIAGASSSLKGMTDELGRVSTTIAGQNRSSLAITQAIERVRALAEELHVASQQSSNDSREITEAARSVADQAKNLASASAAQRATSADIVTIIEGIGQEAHAVVARAGEVNVGTQALASDAGRLDSELAHFTITSNAEPRAAAG